MLFDCPSFGRRLELLCNYVSFDYGLIGEGVVLSSSTYLSRELTH